MSSTFTTAYGVEQPEVGAAADFWGGILNNGFADLDAILTSKATTGSANAYVLTSGLSLAAYVDGQTFRIRANFTNTAAATLNVDALGAKNIYAKGAPLNGGELVTGRIYTVAYDGSRFNLENSFREADFSGLLYGLSLSNSAGDATNDIDIAAGLAIDGTNARIMALSSALTKRLDAAWAVGTNQGGLDTGSIANTTYHMWLIMRSDTGVVDVLFSASASSPTMPSNYDYKRRIGSILRESAAIVAFVQDGDYFWRNVAAADVTASNPGTSAVNRALSVPGGGIAEAIVTFTLDDSSYSGTSYGLLTNIVLADTTPSSNAHDLRLVAASGDAAGESVVKSVKTSSSGSIRTRISASSATMTLRIITHGWRDSRGRV